MKNNFEIFEEKSNTDLELDLMSPFSLIKNQIVGYDNNRTPIVLTNENIIKVIRKLQLEIQNNIIKQNKSEIPIDGTCTFGLT